MNLLASDRHIYIRTVLRRLGGRLVWMGGMLAAIALSAHAAAPQPKPGHETLCAFSMHETDKWQRVRHAQNVALQRIPSSPAPDYYQNGSAAMVVYCAPRFDPDFDISVAREVSAISHSYISFSVLQHDYFHFHNAPAQWFLFSGSLKLNHISKHGYLIVADRGERSLVIALSTNADANHENATLFRSAVQLFSLR